LVSTLFRYVDYENEVIRAMPLGNYEVDSESGEHMAECVARIAKTMGLPVKNLLAVGMDNSKNVFSESSDFTRRLQRLHPNIIQARLGCRSIQSSIKHAMNFLPSYVWFMLDKVYLWFGEVPARWSKYVEVWRRVVREEWSVDTSKLRPKPLASPKDTRWTCFFDLVVNMQHQLSALHAYFKEELKCGDDRFQEAVPLRMLVEFSGSQQLACYMV
jgi:energy-converting hydrogenase A subunit M